MRTNRAGNRTDANVNRPGPRRDSTATRSRILQAAMAEFAEHGYKGARVERIVAAADANVRMLYHYFGDKDRLYLAVLEQAYLRIRTLEQEYALSDQDPVAAMSRLVEVTFDFLATDPYFVRLVMNENLMKGEMIRRTDSIAGTTRPLVASLDRILRRGQEAGVFHRRIDSGHLYISILSLCFIHISNRYTLSSMFRRDLSDPKWLNERKNIASDIILTYLTTTPGQQPGPQPGSV